ncbi:hypothetical protein KSD_17230 [Ktedonobacter sp. SOSP1-85]|uniref:tetratricopeptide repeat protein n=1 Tax=Ktedonobacter sp. SOSP1-85 TaxID=2778367 RepID=UPI001915AD05|nr:tetratricopeptide repeat protein [Ktedonobacter sp. SOSP1-85]GHO73952.1 hypothetical protein KSD_17230 [Ktedonobacter sp. SOSP1-85]
MTVIRIQEQTTKEHESVAVVSFDYGIQFPITVKDPFADDSARERDLEWYFEEHLSLPFLETVRAQKAARSIREYGEILFKQIFADPRALASYQQARMGGLETLRIEIAGSPIFDRLHWEALYDPELKEFLALYASVWRQNIAPQTFPADMRSSTTINILVVVARPAGAQDVGYRTISRPLLDALKEIPQPVRLTLLRPGTYRALDEHLERTTGEHKAGYYHVIHFDVHGALLNYEQFQQGTQTSRYVYQSRFGRDDIQPYEGEKAYLFLESEKEEAQADPVEASEVAKLLFRHKIPIAILNACQSGKFINGSGEESSLGSYLIRAGVQSVLSMAYSVTVSAAELLMPVLYRELFANQNLSTALSRARRALANQKTRHAYYNQTIDLEDWLLPVVYQNKEVRFALQPFTPQQESAYYQEQAARYRIPQEPSYGFLGRDIDILQLEKRLLLKRNIVLVRGMGGAGKTTLLHHLATWWQHTELVKQVFYFGYDERAWTRQQVMRTIAQKLLRREEFALFQARGEEAQQAQLATLLNSSRHLLILDNLESITGTHFAIRHTLSSKEQKRLQHFLTGLVGGQTLVLLGSRGEEAWLSKSTFEKNCYDLGGLDPEAASILTERILERYYVTRYRQEMDLRTLVKVLDGYPLALEIVLANLARQTPTQVLSALQTGAEDLHPGASEKRTENILRCVDYSHSNLSAEDQHLLLCLAPFTSIIYQNSLKHYIAALKRQPALEHLAVERLPDVLREAQNRGLLAPDPDVPSFLHLQPILPYFLRNRLGNEERREMRAAIEKAFYACYREISQMFNDLLVSNQAEERNVGMVYTHFEYENLSAAFDFALRENTSFFALYKPLSLYLERTQEHQRGEDLDAKVLAKLEKGSSGDIPDFLNEEFVRTLGLAANRQMHLKQHNHAKKMYDMVLRMMESLKLEEKEQVVMQAGTLNNLGIVSQEQHQWDQAERYYQQALQIYVDHQVYYEQASTLHNLGIVAQEKRQWDQAERYYQQALQIYIDYQERYKQAITLHNLGIVSQEKHQLDQAERYYQQALQIKIDYQARYEQASTLHQLGRVAQEKHQLDQAERYYQQALQIKIDYQDRYEQASTLHQLGRVAQEKCQWDQAERYYQQALQIYIDHQVYYEQASTLRQLGRVAQEKRQWDQAERYYQQALQIYIDYQDHYEQAKTLHPLGVLAQEQHQWDQAEQYFVQTLLICGACQDMIGTTIALESLARFWQVHKDVGLVERIATLLASTSEEIEKLFQEWSGSEQ